MDQPRALTHHFKVQFTHPTRNRLMPEGREYEATMFLGVMARTIEGAIEAVRREYPRATIYTVSHQGKIQVDAEPLDGGMRPAPPAVVETGD